MLALAYLVNLRAHKLTRLCAGRFSLARVPTRAFDGSFVRHNYFLAAVRGDALPFPAERPLDAPAG